MGQQLRRARIRRTLSNKVRQRAAVLSILTSFLNYHFAGLDPLTLAAAE